MRSATKVESRPFKTFLSIPPKVCTVLSFVLTFTAARKGSGVLVDPRQMLSECANYLAKYIPYETHPSILQSEFCATIGCSIWNFYFGTDGGCVYDPSILLALFHWP